MQGGCPSLPSRAGLREFHTLERFFTSGTWNPPTSFDVTHELRGGSGEVRVVSSEARVDCLPFDPNPVSVLVRAGAYVAP